MTMNQLNLALPNRFHRLAVWQYVVTFALGAFFVTSFKGIELDTLSLSDLFDIPKNILYVLNRMFPPSLERLGAVSRAMLETLEMSIVGNLVGVPISCFFAVLAAKNLSPHPAIYYSTRAVITFLRTTPSLVWAIFMIVAVGLGARAGTVTLVIATIGFCGRFFAEAIEEVHKGPQEALTALGASKIGAVFSSVFPAAMPSFINTTLFNLEHTTRSSAVLGIVGAGGIGIELMVSIKTFRYDEAATIIIMVFLMVISVEQLCAQIRRKII